MTQPLQDVIYRFDTTEQLRGWSPGSSSKYEGALVSTGGYYTRNDGLGGLYRLERNTNFARRIRGELSVPVQNGTLTPAQARVALNNVHSSHILELPDDFIAVSTGPIELVYTMFLSDDTAAADADIIWSVTHSSVPFAMYDAEGDARWPVYYDLPGDAIHLWFTAPFKARLSGHLLNQSTGLERQIINFGTGEPNETFTVVDTPARAVGVDERLHLLESWFDMPFNPDPNEAFSSSGSRLFIPAGSYRSFSLPEPAYVELRLRLKERWT